LIVGAPVFQARFFQSSNVESFCSFWHHSAGLDRQSGSIPSSFFRRLHPLFAFFSGLAGFSSAFWGGLNVPSKFSKALPFSVAFFFFFIDFLKT